MDRKAIKRALQREFDQVVDASLDAVENAPDGRLIAASEWAVRGEFQGLLQRSFQTIVQAKLDAADEAAFSPSGHKEQSPREQGKAGD